MIDIKKYELSTTGICAPVVVATWGGIKGNIEDQQDLVDYVESHGGGGDAVWGSITGDIEDQEDLNNLLEDYALKEWVEGQDYYTPETAHTPVEYHDLEEDPEIEIEDPRYDPKTMRLIEPGEDGFIIGDYHSTNYDGTDEINGFYFGRNQNGYPIAGRYKYFLYEKPAGVFTPDEQFYQFVTEDQLSTYATRQWVTGKGYATQSWVRLQGYITSSALDGYATEDWVGQVALEGYATEQWVYDQGYLTSESLSGYATESWVSSQNYLTSTALTGYATESWVSSQGYLTEHQSLDGYATESWVSSQNYLTSTALTGYATESWVGSQGYITTSALSGYATESWVQNQGYYQQLPGYYAIEKRILSMDPDTEDKPEDYPIDEYVDYDYLTIGYCDTGETWRFDGVRLGEEGAGIYTITPVETEVEGETVIEYQEDYDSFVTQSYLLPIEDDLGDITVRVTALETNYGDAITITNNILGE